MKQINFIVLFFFFIVISYSQQVDNENNIENTINIEELEKQQTFTKIKEVSTEDKAKSVKIQILNKSYTKMYEYTISINQELDFEKIKILPIFCLKSNEFNNFEKKALFKIFKKNKKNIDEQIFYGWLFTSSKSISSLEDPEYDVILKDCK